MTTMTTDRAQGLVITAFAVSGALVLVRDGAEGHMPPVRFVIGTTLAAVMLSTLAQTAPTLAGGFSLLVMTTAALVYGGPAWKTLTTAVSGGK